MLNQGKSGENEHDFAESSREVLGIFSILVATLKKEEPLELANA